MIPDGIYESIPFPTYATGEEWKGRMNPGCIELAVVHTMAHVKADFDGLRPNEETAALSFGSAFHCALLEPERFARDYSIGEQCTATTGKGSRCSKAGIGRFGGQWACSIHAPEGMTSEVERITVADDMTIKGMAARVKNHPAIKLLRQQGPAEVCIAWTDPRSGVACKSRLDKFIPELSGGGSMILDLKSVESADPRSVAEKIEKYGWARAGEMRRDGVEVLTGRRPDYSLVCVEKEAPYAVAAVMFDDETCRGAAWEVRGNLQLWANCVKSGNFPEWSDDFVELSVPDWKIKYYRTVVQGDNA